MRFAHRYHFGESTSFLGTSGVFNLIFAITFKHTDSVLRHHIWGYAVCLCPTKRMPYLFGLAFDHTYEVAKGHQPILELIGLVVKCRMPNRGLCVGFGVFYFTPGVYDGTLNLIASIPFPSVLTFPILSYWLCPFDSHNPDIIIHTAFDLLWHI